MCEGVQRHARVCKGMQGCVRVCNGVQGCAREAKIKLKYELSQDEIRQEAKPAIRGKLITKISMAHINMRTSLGKYTWPNEGELARTNKRSILGSSLEKIISLMRANY